MVDNTHLYKGLHSCDPVHILDSFLVHFFYVASHIHLLEPSLEALTHPTHATHATHSTPIHAGPKVIVELASPTNHLVRPKHRLVSNRHTTHVIHLTELPTPHLRVHLEL
mmetsp:Transcript_32700/g.31923  ORF Transcript_32700/g.31923 Transcript_32700/m.31923 type:complete len:110 (+) Transcript_32700:1812-2141(+)